MSESNELAIAFQNVRKFENYRFLRSWGVTIIVFGVFSFVIDTRLTQIFILAVALGMRGITDTLTFFFNVLMIVVLLVIIWYTFHSVKIISIKKSRVITSMNLRLGFAIVAMYLISPRILIIFFNDFGTLVLATFSIRISEVIGTFMTYLILKNSMKSHNFKEILYLSLIFTFFMIMDVILLISIIFLMPNIFFIYLLILYSFGMTACYATCYIITGRYSLRKAQIILQL